MSRIDKLERKIKKLRKHLNEVVDTMNGNTDAYDNNWTDLEAGLDKWADANDSFVKQVAGRFVEHDREIEDIASSQIKLIEENNDLRKRLNTLEKAVSLSESSVQVTGVPINGPEFTKAVHDDHLKKGGLL